MLYYFCMDVNGSKVTDTIPRTGIAQIVRSVAHLAKASGATTYDDVRAFLQNNSTRSAPASSTAMWTVARDVLSELDRLGYAEVGTLPRRRSDVERVRESPCRLTESGTELANTFQSEPGRAYDRLLLDWGNQHPHFRAFVTRIDRSPLYVPDITSISQIGTEWKNTCDIGELQEAIVGGCMNRLAAVSYPDEKANTFREGVEARLRQAEAMITSPELDSKRIVDTIQDSIVLPSFLASEGLSFDAVTFHHIIKCSEEFFSAAAASSHPSFVGRVVFSTCDFEPALSSVDGTLTGVVHHGYSYAVGRFRDALCRAYKQVAGASPRYVESYEVRAVVCVELGIQPQVFARCMQDLIQAGADGDPVVYTELPFESPPAGEKYLEVNGRRIGRLKLVTRGES